MLRQGIDHELGIEPVLDYAALVFGAPLERRLVDLGQPCLARHLQEIRTESRRECQDGARVVQVFIDQLVVHAHAMPQSRLLRHQRRIGKHLVDVVEDQRRLHDRLAVVDQRRHDPVRIELEIFRLVLVAAQRQDMVLGLLAFLLQCDAYLLRADRIDVVVEFQHAFLPLTFAGHARVFLECCIFCSVQSRCALIARECRADQCILARRRRAAVLRRRGTVGGTCRVSPGPPPNASTSTEPGRAPTRPVTPTEKR